ncbi:heterokaryon incompatibility protein-domain-containing protein [Xylaria sp. FL0064]|nr:heterokaryon incompatibility protein-domain-containing protein [Xylaria sp. FL0064]
MRLMNAHTRQIHNFISSDDSVDFAILSHTWGSDEVTLQDWQSLSTAELELKEGYRKIDHCCKQAANDGYDWVWIDTCCIDKTSSAELSEAINSMFRWYQDAALCYAHLQDVSDDVTEDALLPALTESRWFTRGWTLQELLAPTDVVFFSKNWQRLATKLNSVEILSTITGIEKAYLEGAPLEDASTAKKISWASTRKTTRIEDVAYCLLGIFDVNMPLIYGEGKKAFRRLQEEIMKAKPEDHTLFAWGDIVEKMSDIPYIIADRQEAAEMEIPWDASKVTQPLLGLLAESPADFKSSGGFVMANVANKFYKYAPKGIITAFPQTQDKSTRLHLPVRFNVYQSKCYWERPQLAVLRGTAVAILLCCHEKSPNHLPGILLRSCSEKTLFSRTREICLRYTGTSISLKPVFFNYRAMINIGPQRHIRIESGDIIFRRYIWDNDTAAIGSRPFTQSNAVSDGTIKMHGIKNGPIGLLFHHHCQVSCRHAFSLKFERIEINSEDMAGLAVSLVPMDNGPPEGTKFKPLKPDFDLKWSSRSECARCDIPPEFRKVLEMPSGTVVIDILPFPVVTVKAERVSLNPNGNIKDAFVDVLDILIAGRLLPYHPTQHQGSHEKVH